MWFSKICLVAVQDVIYLSCCFQQGNNNIGIASSTCRHCTLSNSVMCSNSYPIPILSLFFLYHPYIPYFLIQRIFHFLFSFLFLLHACMYSHQVTVHACMQKLLHHLVCISSRGVARGEFRGLEHPLCHAVQ